MNLPSAFVERMQAQLGADYPAFEAGLQQPAAISLRLNPAKHSVPLALEQVPWTQHGYYLPERPLFTLDPWLHAGSYYVQEASSMLLEQALTQHLDLEEPLVAMDLCGAPGGKSTHLMSVLPVGSLLVSNEVIRSRVPILAENVQKWGTGQVIVTQNDPREIGQIGEQANLLVVDAPCSGEGLFRKDAAAVDEWSPANLQRCVERQRRILADVWPVLKPGGLLVYSTCTFHPAENEENLAWLAREANIASLSLALPSEWGFQEVQHHGIIGYYALPHRVRGEGFFLAVLRKGGQATATRVRKPKQSAWQPVPKSIRAQVQDWISSPGEEMWTQVGDQICRLTDSFPAAREAIGSQLRVVAAGTAVAEGKPKALKPAHGLALSVDRHPEAFLQQALDLDQAIAYLRRETLALGSPETGWRLLTYAGQPLGWGKMLPNRLNNAYPTHWRIRMQYDAQQGAPFELRHHVRR